MASSVLPSDVTLRKGVSRKLLILGTVVGALSFLSPAYAGTLVWDFSTPITSAPTVTYLSTPDSIPVVAAGEPFAGGVFPSLVTSTVGTGVGLSGGVLAPGQWIALDISAIPDFARAALSFQADSVAAGDIWEVFASNSAANFGTTLLGRCSFADSGDACNALTTLSAVPAGDTFVDVSAQAGSIVLRELDATVPLPGALWLFGTGLAGLGFVSRRRRSKKVSVL
jgi:hypothetical protein